jgi:hypothetical protein
MPDNYNVKDAADATITIRAKDISGNYSPRVIPTVADADVSTANPMPSKILLSTGVARQISCSAVSANTTLTAGIKAISIFARGGDVRFAIGNSSQTASATSHYVATGERLDIDVSQLSTPNIAVIRGPAATDCILELSELS